MIPRVFHWAELAPFDPFVVSLSWQSKSLFFFSAEIFISFFMQPRNVTFSLHFKIPSLKSCPTTSAHRFFYQYRFLFNLFADNGFKKCDEPQYIFVTF